MSDVNYRQFKLGESRFDQDTFVGRFRHFLDIIDPTTLFTSQKTLDKSIQILEDYKNGTLTTSLSDKELWQAQKIKQAIIHPDTGEKIFMPFRMSGYVPFGSPIVTGLLLPNPTLIQTVFWQWLNQSHNACVNYSNRNATKDTPMTRFVTGYIGAVSSAVGIAIGLGLLLKRADRFSPATKVLVQKFIPFPAVATASVCNVLLMRKHELSDGIELVDKNGNVVGTSKLAAKKALTEMAVTRAVLPAPILILPPLIMTALEKTKFLMRRPWLHLPLNATACTLSFAFALPLAIALFPQMSQIGRESVEDEIRNKHEDLVFLYNKGL